MNFSLSQLSGFVDVTAPRVAGDEREQRRRQKEEEQRQVDSPLSPHNHQTAFVTQIRGTRITGLNAPRLLTNKAAVACNESKCQNNLSGLRSDQQQRDS